MKRVFTKLALVLLVLIAYTNFTIGQSCPPVENLTATVNSDNTVTLNWDNPVPPSTCSGDLYFEFFLGTVYIGYDGTDDLTTWTTNVLANGTHTLRVKVYYFNSSGDYICRAESSTTVTITGSFDCPPVENLTATINSDNTVTLNWDNPDPSTCPSTDIDYWFYNGDTYIAYDYTDGLTSCPIPMLEQGTYNFGVQVAYYE
ncbi:MAG TPA: hypothetical protein PK124_05925, partial [Bacteroidales bacterium]|nr:hypothetical protein [Bacteroidales bacterium]